MDWSVVEKMSLEGKNAGEIARTLGLDYEKTRAHIKKWRKHRGLSRENHGHYTGGGTPQIPENVFQNDFSRDYSAPLPTPGATTRSKYSYHRESNISVYEDEQRVLEGQEITPELIMKAKGLRVSEWDVINFTKNVWQQQTKEGLIDLCQSELTVRPKKQPEISLEELEAFFDEKTFRNLPTAESEPPKPPEGAREVLEVDIADLHSGLLSWEGETGEDFDMKICRDRFLSAMEDIVDRARGRAFAEIYVCALGDILHIDNDLNTTTKGTQQQADGRMAYIFDYTFDTMNAALAILRRLEAPIRYIYTCGNHDRNVGYYLVRCLEKANPDILFDSKPNPQKAIHFGKVLVGLTHGDFPAKNRGKWLLTDFRKEFGESRWVEEHSGHIHEETAKTINGVMCRSMPTLTGCSAWEHQQGYRSERASQCFVWDAENGLRESWYLYL